MIEFFVQREQRILMARITGTYDIGEMIRLDDFVRAFVAGQGEMRGLYDFSNVEQITVPMTRLAERAGQPSIIGGMRVLVAPRSVGIGMTRMFSEHQSNAGQTAPMVVGRLEEAYVLLGLHYKAHFEPIEFG